MKGHLLRSLAILMFALGFIFHGIVLPVYADTLPDSEIKALDEYPNWVGLCGSAINNELKTAGNDQVFIIGDSITHRSQSQYEAAFQQKGLTGVIDASDSRSLNAKGTTGNKLSGMEVIRESKDKIQNAAAVVVALGTNGGNTDDTVAKAIDAIGAGKKIFWVDTIAVGRSDDSIVGPGNRAIYEQAKAKKFQVISWFNTVDEQGDPQHPAKHEKDPHKYIDTSDGLGVHPTSGGSTALAELVTDAVSKDLQATAGDPTAPDDSSGQPFCCPSENSSGENISLTGNTNAEKAFNFFIGAPINLTKEQAAGVVGNMVAESGVDPENIQNPGGSSRDPNDAGSAGWGIIQWTPGSKIIGIARDQGVTGPIYELGTQLQIVYNHMKGTSPTGVVNMLDAYRKITGTGPAAAGAAAIEFEQKMEGAGIKAYPARVGAAKAVLREFGDNAAGDSTVSGDAGANGCGGGAVSGDLLGTVINYAWPDYHPAPYLKRKQAYANAVATAQQQGLYVGGSVGGVAGIDCGGFVTRVMLDSGFEPGYNFNGKGGNTIEQQKWLDQNWRKLSPEEFKDTSKLQPGDVAINDDHTYMYVGKINNFNSVTASASYSQSGNGRAPMAGHEAAGDPNFSWYRKK